MGINTMNTDISSNSKPVSCYHDGNVYYVSLNDNDVINYPQTYNSSSSSSNNSSKDTLTRASIPQGSIIYDDNVENKYPNKKTGIYGESVDGIGLSADELSDITGLNPKVSEFLIEEFNRDKGVQNSFIADDDIIDFIDFLADDIGLDLDKTPKSNKKNTQSNKKPITSNDKELPLLSSVNLEANDGLGLSSYEISKLYKLSSEEEAETYMRNFMYNNGHKEQALSGKMPILSPQHVNDFHKFIQQQ
jgi:hypothetical protein